MVEPGTQPPPSKRRRQKTLAEKQPKKVVKHVLDDPFKISWPRNTPQQVASFNSKESQEICEHLGGCNSVTDWNLLLTWYLHCAILLL